MALSEPDFLRPPFAPEIFSALLALNNDHAAELSFKTPQGFAQLLEAASHVRATAEGHALLVAFDETCDYDNANFRWLKQHYNRFYYVDRVVVGAAARGQAMASKLYVELEARTLQEGRERLVCEINRVPPNPGSDSFHEFLGFAPVGEAALGGGKVVRYWAKELNPTQSAG